MTAETETRISLPLSAEEAGELREALTEYLSELSVEIAGTESQDFRDRLKKRQELLRGVAHSLGRLSA
jgi:hypothetical protein